MIAESNKLNIQSKFVLIHCFLFFPMLVLSGCGDGNIPVASVLSSGRVTLSWNDVPGAASYELYISTSPGITTLNSYKISDVTPPITLTDLEPGTTYYFMLAVFSDSGEGRTSKEFAYKVTETEGEIEFGDILAKPDLAPQDQPSAKTPAATPAKEPTTGQKAQPQVAAVPVKKPDSEIIICFGDSLTSGTGASAGMDYPSQLSRMIGKPVINRGIPGDTTSTALRRLNRDVLSADPDIVLITLGGNDLKNGVSKNSAFSNLKYIVDTIQQRGARVIIGGLKFPGMDRGFGKGYEDLAKQTGATLVPNIFAGVADNRDLMSDPIHPNNAGYRIIAQRFQKALEPGQKTIQTAGQIAAIPAAKRSSSEVQKKVPGTQDVTLAWDDVPNATSYNIYYRDSKGVTKDNGAEILNATNPYKLKNLIKGKTYYFIVTAVNASGESPPSEEFSFTVGGAN